MHHLLKHILEETKAERIVWSGTEWAREATWQNKELKLSKSKLLVDNILFDNATDIEYAIQEIELHNKECEQDKISEELGIKKPEEKPFDKSLPWKILSMVLILVNCVTIFGPIGFISAVPVGTIIFLMIINNGDMDVNPF